MMTRLELQAVVAIILVAGLIIIAKLIDHHGFARGVTDRTAYYEPILRKAAEAKIAADARADAADRRSLTITAQVENDHAGIEASLVARAGVAESRIADLLRRRAPATPHCGVPVPAVPGSPAVSPGAAAGDPRDGRLAERVSGVGRQCEHDANALAAWQEWYDRQRASLTNSAPGP
jgi:hypothetical protein